MEDLFLKLVTFVTTRTFCKSICVSGEKKVVLAMKLKLKSSQHEFN